MAHFVRALDRADRSGGVAHLYLHSWEIDAGGQWDRLESAMRTASGYEHLRRQTNGELYAEWQALRREAAP